MLNYNLMTSYYNSFDKNAPLPEYPRPEFVRDSFLNLNGVWKYCISNTKAYPGTFEKDIIVPYVIESAISGVRYDIKPNEYLWYQKTFTLTKEYLKDITMLHFDGVFQKCDVYINDNYLGHHDGGYLPFSFDVRNYVDVGENVITVCVENTPDLNYSVGKEAHKRGLWWYTRTTGIWKTVWIESYENEAIYAIDVRTRISGEVRIKINSPNDNFKIEIKYKNKLVKEILSLDKDIITHIDDPLLWTPENPHLYTITISNYFDKVTSYFAFREISIINGYFYLNNKKIFINSVLDQGYFSDGIYTPASYDAFKDDIVKMKSLGFNSLRKHVKVEPSMYYYLADKLGILILQDFPNSGKFNFFHDTVLPNLGIIRWLDGGKVGNKERKRNFIEEGTSIINMLRLHPSVIYYTIFNEGWGQFEPDRLYDYFKREDPTRIFDTTSGWFMHKKSDVESIHNYFHKIVIPKKKRPVMLSEFGGYSLKVQSHSFNQSNKNYGYKFFNDSREYTKAICATYENDILANMNNGLAGCIYTQVSDIEDETNGFLTYDRAKMKVDENMLRKVLKKIHF